MILATPASTQKALSFIILFANLAWFLYVWTEMKHYHTHTVVFVIGKPFLVNMTYCVSGTCSQL